MREDSLTDTNSLVRKATGVSRKEFFIVPGDSRKSKNRIVPGDISRRSWQNTKVWITRLLTATLVHRSGVPFTISSKKSVSLSPREPSLIVSSVRSSIVKGYSHLSFRLSLVRPVYRSFPESVRLIKKQSKNNQETFSTKGCPSPHTSSFSEPRKLKAPLIYHDKPPLKVKALAKST